MQTRTYSNCELNTKLYSNKGNTLISIIPPEKLDDSNRSPIDLCCVIDTSLSMKESVEIQDDKGIKESFGLSILDILKHSVNTIIHSLTENDRLALVTFSSTAKVRQYLTFMDDSGKKEAENILNSIYADGSTNLWDGLSTGLDILNEMKDPTRISALFLLTDGIPTEVPPRGHKNQMKSYISKKGIPGIINTFGFGYNLDSNLLLYLAKEGNGSFNFIPDGGFIGTVFINALSTLLSTFATNVKLKIKFEKEHSIEDFSLISNHSINFDEEKNTLNISLGSIIFGQTKDLLLNLDEGEKIKMTLSYDNTFLRGNTSLKHEFIIKNDFDKKILIEKSRFLSLNTIITLNNNFKKENIFEIQTKLNDLILQIKESLIANEPFIIDLIRDLEGQVTLALTKNEYYNKWGQHYLSSLTRSYLVQQCNNFKDYAVQHFGGKFFEETRDNIEELFLKIPPPIPSVNNESGASWRLRRKITDKISNPIPSNVQINMKKYYNKSGGCFHGDCLVELYDKKSKKVKEIKKNDLIVGPQGQPIKIVCVVKTKIKSGKIRFVEFPDGLKITPWHPVKLDKEFVFPKNLFQEKTFNCDEMFDFVLESGHLIKINDIECVTLGHKFTDNDVVKHEFFGSDKIINSLKKLDGWENGYITILDDKICRDLQTNRIKDIKD